ncbi:MAG TPA: hypothetical protein VN193_07600 [Candidatus Angelobacter sp.]|jgi:hypothetical protein|nr:hypothetical protein [Candidatus Angelobacter sp.]
MSDADPSPQIQDDMVEALVVQVRELLRMEDGRGQSFHARAGALAGFSGLIVSVSGAVGANIFKPDLSTPWKWTAAALLATILLTLLMALYLVMFGVLIPKESAGFSLSEVQKYPTWGFITQTRVQTQGRILHGLIEMLAVDRDRNGRKADCLRMAYRLLGGAVASFATLGVILGLHAQSLI